MDFSWHPSSVPAPNSDLLGVVGEIRPFQYRTVPRILHSSRRIESQLADSPGLVGYTLRAEFFCKRFWAVSVWEDEESLQRFVATKPHVDIMAALTADMETSRFERFTLKGEDVPIGIDDAIVRATADAA